MNKQQKLSPQIRDVKVDQVSLQATGSTSKKKNWGSTANKKWSIKHYIGLAAIVVPAGVSIFKVWYNGKIKKMEQKRQYEYTLTEIAQTGKTRIDAIDRTHSHKMDEKKMDLENASEKMELEYEIWERKETFRERQAQKKRDEIDYDHPIESMNDTIHQPNRIKKFDYISDTPLTTSDLACIYSMPAIGKSILANQILIGAASGTPTGIGCFIPDNLKPMYALLYDAEQTDEDIQVRYGNHDLTLPHIDRVQDCNFDDDPMLLVNDIKRKVWEKKIDSIVCIDNTSKMFPTIKARLVTQTIRTLEKLQEQAKKDGFNLAIILVTHSVKVPGKSKEVHNMSGSANWSRFAKTVISLSPTEDDKFKVMKIEKNRRGKQGEEFILRIEANPYVHFVNDASATENYLLKKPTKEELKGWPSKICGVSRILALEIESAYIPGKYGAGSLYRQFQNRPGITNEKKIQRIIKKVQELRRSQV